MTPSGFLIPIGDADVRAPGKSASPMVISGSGGFQQIRKIANETRRLFQIVTPSGFPIAIADGRGACRVILELLLELSLVYRTRSLNS